MALISLTNLPCFLVEILKNILMMILSCISLLKSSSTTSKQEIDDLVLERFPSPLLVDVPMHFIVKSIKDHLTVSDYREIISHVSNHEPCDRLCAVCLTAMEGCDEVRKLPNCSHVFHKDCIDAWIDKCKTTCPVCRSSMLLSEGEKLKCGVDPWRRDRMVFLFGEDFLF